MIGDRARRPAGGLGGGRARGAGEDRLRAGRAGVARRHAGRGRRISSPRTSWRRWSGSCAVRGRGVKRARRAADRGRTSTAWWTRSAASGCWWWPTSWPTSSCTAPCSGSAARRRCSSSSTTARTCAWAAARTRSHNIATLGGAPDAPGRPGSATTPGAACVRSCASGASRPARWSTDARLRHAGQDAHPGRRRALDQAADRAHRHEATRLCDAARRASVRRALRASRRPRRRRAGERLRLRPGRPPTLVEAAVALGAPAPRARHRRHRATRCSPSAA